MFLEVSKEDSNDLMKILFEMRVQVEDVTGSEISLLDPKNPSSYVDPV